MLKPGYLPFRRHPTQETGCLRVSSSRICDDVVNGQHMIKAKGLDGEKFLEQATTFESIYMDGAAMAVPSLSLLGVYPLRQGRKPFGATRN